MSDEVEVADEPEYYEDDVASRAAAYRRLMVAIAELPAEAADLRAEGLDMLSAVRRSFKTERQAGDVRPIRGGAP